MPARQLLEVEVWRAGRWHRVGTFKVPATVPRLAVGGQATFSRVLPPAKPPAKS